MLNIALIAWIGYLAVSEKWLPAIFFLLARKEIVKWLDAIVDRIMAQTESARAQN